MLAAPCLMCCNPAAPQAQTAGAHCRADSASRPTHMIERKGQGRSSTMVVFSDQPASTSSCCLVSTRSAARSHTCQMCMLCGAGGAAGGQRVLCCRQGLRGLRRAVDWLRVASPASARCAVWLLPAQVPHCLKTARALQAGVVLTTLVLPTLMCAYRPHKAGGHCSVGHCQLQYHTAGCAGCSTCLHASAGKRLLDSWELHWQPGLLIRHVPSCLEVPYMLQATQPVRTATAPVLAMLAAAAGCCCCSSSACC